ncbi:hypothetical protein KC669_05075 [Candidatus Dojkabacteria bacterium]|uniref:Uncharacterized protein n=1 Tax=Candidatus Dojkabacteria bacterium TaxID=2099670 RepID=A0A955LBX5_9BACT|nr:hypothetical protein [Candidatus Dojkabacteria bacterium]
METDINETISSDMNETEGTKDRYCDFDISHLPLVRPKITSSENYLGYTIAGYAFTTLRFKTEKQDENNEEA